MDFDTYDDSKSLSKELPIEKLLSDDDIKSLRLLDRLGDFASQNYFAETNTSDTGNIDHAAVRRKMDAKLLEAMMPEIKKLHGEDAEVENFRGVYLKRSSRAERNDFDFDEPVKRTHLDPQKPWYSPFSMGYSIKGENQSFVHTRGTQFADEAGISARLMELAKDDDFMPLEDVIDVKTPGKGVKSTLGKKMMEDQGGLGSPVDQYKLVLENLPKYTDVRFYSHSLGCGGSGLIIPMASAMSDHFKNVYGTFVGPKAYMDEETSSAISAQKNVHVLSMVMPGDAFTHNGRNFGHLGYKFQAKSDYSWPSCHFLKSYLKVMTDDSMRWSRRTRQDDEKQRMLDAANQEARREAMFFKGNDTFNG